MKNTLFIQIDNNSLLEECVEDVEVLDCRCINDFCSFVGDALVGDLKDESGTPFYRLYSPAGKLLLEFKNNRPESFEILLSDWYNVLTVILRNGNDGSEEMELLLTDDFSDWLLMHENKHYVAMGQQLKDNGNVVLLSRKELLDCIIPSITRQVREKISIHKGNLRAIVFGGDIKVGQSYITSKVLVESFDKTDPIQFFNLNDWKTILEKELRERIDSLDDRRAFKVDDFVLGEPVPTNFKQVEGNLDYKGGQIKISNGVCESIIARKGTEAFDNLTLCIFTNNRTVKSQSFVECHHHLNSLGFKVLRTNLSVNKEFQTASGLPTSKLETTLIAARLNASIAMGAALLIAANIVGQITYKESLIKETDDFECELKFYSEKGIPGDANNLDYRRNMPNTLDKITVSVKHDEG